MGKDVLYNFTNDLMFKLVLQSVPEAAIELAKKFIPGMEDLVYDESQFKVLNPINITGIELKSTQFDFKFSLAKNNLFEYEMQKNNTKYDIRHRMVKYFTDLISNSYAKDDYDVRKCYCLWFLNFKLFNDEKDIHTFYLQTDDNLKLLNYDTITVVEIAKFKETSYNIDRWKKLFVTNDIETLKGDDVMDKVVKIMYDYNSDEAIKEQLRAEEEWQRHVNTTVSIARAEGRAEGIKEITEKTVINCYKNGINIDIIKDITSLDISKIKEILKDNDLI